MKEDKKFVDSGTDRLFNDKQASKTLAQNLTKAKYMKDQKYNGWTNYATWRVNLEIFDGLHSDIDGEKATAEGCK